MRFRHLFLQFIIVALISSLSLAQHTKDLFNYWFNQLLIETKRLDFEVKVFHAFRF